ncbi:MAG: HAMP domain-containing histidine kinase [Firmicutes bacterium]|nr:HAMP domain-containing histidine kinase [Bacillota bacterium]
MPENIPNIDTSLFAHGIKNRLSFIRSRLQLMELEKGEKGAYDSIYRELDGINDSICRLISAPAGAGEKSTFNAKDVIYECVSEKMPQANLNGIKIICRTEDDLTIHAVKSGFRETVINLLQNAIEACPKEGGEIEVAGKTCGGKAEISVSDNGCGISEGNRKNIFKPFFTTKKSGSGIGLYSCRKFAEDSGGELTVAGNRTKGTKVTLILPVSQGRCP